MININILPLSRTLASNEAAQNEAADKPSLHQQRAAKSVLILTLLCTLLFVTNASAIASNENTHHAKQKNSSVDKVLATAKSLHNDNWSEKNSSENSQEENWSDDWAEDWVEEEAQSPWQLTGFVEAGYGQFLHTNIVKNSASLNELRARINLDYSHELFDASSKIDSYYDAVLAKTVFQTRELSISASPFSFLDIKAGRQVLTWGTGDYLFLNDLFAKDWQAFFSGRADEYLKAPSTSVRTNWFFNEVNFTLVWTPEFTADNYINGERFSFYSPQAQQIVAPAQRFSVDKTSKAQWSARLNTRINDVEVSLYGYQGSWPTPVGSKPSIEQHTENSTLGQSQGYFPKLNSWGISALTPFQGGIINIEYASYNSTEDSNGQNDNIANGQHRLLIGYERELAKNLTASMQYYLERTKHYQALLEHSAAPEQLVDENRQLLTLRLSYRALRQTLIYSMFAFYSPSDRDGYLKPSLNYQYSDQWLFSTGANLFFGDNDYSFFGQHQDNSNAWLRVRYQY
ncbi:hypothetical protein EKO29_18680 [Colwellia sp. Arc7-635]|uniref:hypothetical protein n=1 Tax=Colwellia sp. Arc7-635 TaxID=2497879 RepID=UPI000F85ABF9|nr:hypothetical protein [Colwellia sp. Arc7-635]AZQ85844.1 hypothetical protein EKO29_18680 [Colwellia sp. Arc7-635]